MNSTMVQRAPFRPHRRLGDGLRPAPEADHLHFDRDARAWRSHVELDRGFEQVVAAGPRLDAAMQECA